MEEAILCAQKRNLILLEVSGKLDKHPFDTMGDFFFSFEPIYVHSQIWSPEAVNFLTLRMWEVVLKNGTWS